MKKDLLSLKKIDKEAKRELQNVRKFRDDNQLLFISFVLLIAAAVIINTAYVINQSSVASRSTTTNTQQDTIHRSLERAVTPAATVVVNNVTESDKADPAFPLNEDQTLLMVDLTITNTTSVQQHIIPVNQAFVRDRDGGYYPLQATIHATKPLEGQDLAPGASASGQLAFAVPKRQTSPLLFLDLGWDNHSPIVFDVLH